MSKAINKEGCYFPDNECLSCEYWSDAPCGEVWCCDKDDCPCDTCGALCEHSDSYLWDD